MKVNRKVMKVRSMALRSWLLAASLLLVPPAPLGAQWERTGGNTASPAEPGPAPASAATPVPAARPVLARQTPIPRAPSAPPSAAPVVSLETLRGEGVPGFGSPVEEDAEAVFVKYGRIRSGWALPVDPGEELEFTIPTAGAGAAGSAWAPDFAAGQSAQRVETIHFTLPGGRMSLTSDGKYRLKAPSRSGNPEFRLTVAREVRPEGSKAAPAQQVFHVTLLVRARFNRSGNGLIGNYPVGIYPNEKGRQVSPFVERYRGLYTPPPTFIYSTPQVENLHISEHYTLGEFVPPMDRGKRCYVALSPRLPEMLEAALAQLQPELGSGPNPRPLMVLSGFLSPNHLKQLESKGVELSPFSRYQYGDAAAVIWDGDGDGAMDDLNHDRRINLADAQALADRLAQVQKTIGKFGGIGAVAEPQLPFLPKTPYVDLDMRGVASRW